ncbi:MAG: GGDEF domain-containing protein [Gemmatimonadaceae bacterium]
MHRLTAAEELTSPMTVLLIDADPEQSTQSGLFAADELAGRDDSPFAMERARGLAAGIARLAHGSVDAVILELPQPDTAGIEALRQLRDDHPGIPVVVLTRTDDEQLALRAIATGAQDCLTKSRERGPLLARALLFARERHRLQRELRELAFLDPLTGLQNRRGFLAQAEQLVLLAQRSGRSLVLLFIDLDGLKRVNDSMGHEEGDRTLLEMAAHLRANFRASDVVARIGGDEFAVLAVDAPPGTLSLLVTRLRERIERRNALPNQRHALSISIGAATLENAGTVTVEKMLADADRAMYEHKRELKSTSPAATTQ